MTAPPLIVGAGPTGLAAALFLIERGIKARIIDAAAEPTATSKALGVNPRTLDILSGTGVEAAILAPDVDGVVLVVERGQDPRIVDRSLSRLQQLGARPYGFVFNRASSSDFAASYNGSSNRSETPAAGRPATRKKTAAASPFGPIVDSVSDSLRPVTQL